MLELANRINALCGGKSPLVHGPLPPDDPKTRRPDCTLARRELGWEPRVPVEEGLLRTRDYFYEALGVARPNA
jgi:nucleoside-diphosphate-sugar epimerase